MKRINNFINGKYVESSSAAYFENINPATGEAISHVARSSKSDLEAALQAAKSAFSDWKKRSIEDRAKILYNIAEGIEAKLEDLAQAETADTGKPIQFSRSIDIPRAAANFRFFAAAASQFASESHDMAGKAINYTLRQPIGIVACISPWNLPLYLFTWKIAPALASGNCVIAKPSELSPTTAYMLGQICNDAGLPPGVLNILQGYGSGIGEAMIQHPDIKAISFTGGTKTGARIASLAAPQFKKLSLELGGKNPCIIFSDCDYDRTLKNVVRLAFSNSGQICLCGSRILIEQNIYDRFKADLIKELESYIPADPLDPQTKMGSLISNEHLEKVDSFVKLARAEGGKVLYGGERPRMQNQQNRGAFYLPTVIEGLAPNSRCNMEEIFGPVITLQSFQSEEEALELANASAYGLASTLWTENLSRAHRMSESLQTGIVWINCWLLRDLRTPFGGMNQSGVGREGGWEVMRFFTEAKNVCINFAAR
ncbi:MAG: aldehyde dehydrogenase [Saprospiraceae bacterium]|nr:aldehyde dehydrogenase [Saprospiraceae bacterium]